MAGARSATTPTASRTIALDHPETRNALSDEVLDDLIEAFEIARDDDGVRCVVLTSTHEKVFSSGGNLAGFAADAPLVHKHFGTDRFPRCSADRRARQADDLRRQRHVLAGALGLALACDLIVARDGVRFGTPEINVGVFPFIIMALIYRNVRARRRPRCCCWASRSPRRRPSGSGSSTAWWRPTSSTPRCASGRSSWPAKSPVLMRLGKDALFRQQDMALADALEFLHAQLTIAFSTEDIQEGVKAFFEQRDPVWTGR